MNVQVGFESTAPSPPEGGISYEEFRVQFSVFNLIQPNVIDEANPDEWIKAATAHMVAHLKKYGSVLQVGSFSLGGLSISGSNSASSIPAIPDVVLNILNAGGYLYGGLS